MPCRAARGSALPGSAAASSHPSPCSARSARAACTAPALACRRCRRRRSAYRLGPEDQLRVTVFNDPRLTGDFRVSDAGTIALPLIGTVRAAGRTTEESSAPSSAR